MKKKLILFSSIFALVLSFVFLIPSNKVHALDVEYTEEDYNNFIEPLWELYDEEFHDYYNSYYKYYHDDPIAFIEDYDRSFNDEVYQFAAYVGMFYYINEDLNFSKFPFFMSLYGDEDWIEITTHAGHFDAINCIYSEIGFSSNEYIGAQYEVLYSYAEVKAEINSLIGFNDGFNDGFEDGFNDGSLNSTSSTIKNIFLGKSISLRSYDHPSSYLGEESDMVITENFFNNNQLFFDGYLEHCEEFIPDDFFEGDANFYIRIDLNGLDTSLFEITSTFNNSFVQHEFEFYFTDGSQKIFTRNLEDFITFDFEKHKQIDYILIGCKYEYYPSSFIASNYYDKYLEGFEDGYDNGHTQGKLEGVNTGYDTGYDTGYNKGYKDGLNEKNPIRLDYLFWTIAGLPFETVKTIWDFEFLGVNLANFFTGLLMSLVAIWFVKKFLLK